MSPWVAVVAMVGAGAVTGYAFTRDRKGAVIGGTAVVAAGAVGTALFALVPWQLSSPQTSTTPPQIPPSTP
jgi:hypothetical protein